MLVGFNKWFGIVFVQRLEHVCLIYLRFERFEPIENSSISDKQACQSCLPEAGTWVPGIDYEQLESVANHIGSPRARWRQLFMNKRFDAHNYIST